MSSFIFGLASTVVALLGIAVLVTYSPQNGIILLVIAFLVSPLGLPMPAAQAGKQGAGPAVHDSRCCVWVNKNFELPGVVPPAALDFTFVLI